MIFKKYNPVENLRALSPYFTIAVAAILAYLPVSSMLFSLKNDVVAIEYPIQHYISEALHNGEFPTWFNTWNLGFPLQSILSWSVFSTPQMLSGILFDSNIYVLHSEFIFFIIASGCIMYKLLKFHFINDSNLSLLLACCYMLSGFTVGSSQWLLYITGMTFIPLVTYCLLSLLKTPSLKYSILFAVSFFLFFTNVHIYLTIVSTYILIIFLIIYFVRLFSTKEKDWHENLKIFKHFSLAFFFTVLLCAAPLYYSYEVITCLSRSQPLVIDSQFLQSNYLHPEALSSLLFPLSSVKASHINTDGTVLDTYIGILPLIMFPVSIVINLKQKNNKAWVLLIGSLIFLFISFGHLTPIRGWLNILPGMLHFRHPGVLRVFFILTFILYLALSFKKNNLSKLLLIGTIERKIITITILSLFLFSLFTLICCSGSLFTAWKGSIYQSIKSINKFELLAISSIIQLLFTIILFLIRNKKQQLFSLIIISELIFNTLICTPFFTLSTFSAREVNEILKSPEGFPVQQTYPHDVEGTFRDRRNNSWFNINTFQKEISDNISMPGPLILDKVSLFLSNDSLKNLLNAKQVVFIFNSSVTTTDSIQIKEQRPGEISVQLSLSSSKEIVLQQAYFPGWRAYYNDAPVALTKNIMPFVSTIAPAGKGTLVFKFVKYGVLYSSVTLHLTVLLIILIYLVKKIKVGWASPS